MASLAITSSPGVRAGPPEATEKTPEAATASSERPRDLGHDWPRFLGPGGDGRSSERILLDWPPGGLEVLWFHKVGDGYSTASVANERVFHFDRVGDEARLTAWEAESGAKLWEARYPTNYEDLYQYSGGPRASPIVDGEMVIVYGVEGRLRAHAVRDGTLLWEVDTTARYGVVQNFFGVGSTPVVDEDLLIVQVGGSPAGSPSISSGGVAGNGSTIVAFDKRTGEERYRIGDQLASYSTPRITTIAGRRWGFIFARGGLLAIQPGTGAVDFFYPWRAKKLESVNASTPVLVDDTVFISEAYGPGSSLLRVHPGGYEVVWKDSPGEKAMETHWSTPIHHEGVLYGSSGQSSGEAELRAVEHATGTVLWSEPGLGRSTLLYADGHLLVLTERGRLLLIEATPKRFVQVAEMNLGVDSSTANAAAKSSVDDRPAERPVLRFPAWNAPVLAHGRLYLRGKDQVICLDIAPRTKG